jgi:hypothetical protein
VGPEEVGPGKTGRTVLLGDSTLATSWKDNEGSIGQVQSALDCGPMRGGGLQGPWGLHGLAGNGQWVMGGSPSLWWLLSQWAPGSLGPLTAPTTPRGHLLD